VSWDQSFFDPIELPTGRKLITLRDAANYIVKLSKAEQQAPEWQTAAEVLMLIGERGGDPMMARPYFGATNWPWSQSIVALDCMGSPSFTAVLS
jgi:hypothetical protein